jgi:hypothetical protein
LLITGCVTGHTEPWQTRQGAIRDRRLETAAGTSLRAIAGINRNNLMAVGVGGAIRRHVGL